MKWEDFIEKVRKLPVIEVKAFIQKYPSLSVQVSRWEKNQKLIKIKRGIYILNERYRQQAIFEPYIAAILKRPSYISLEKALEYHNLIPEGVSVFTSVTTKRQFKYISKVGVFDYRHIKPSLFWGYNSVTLKGCGGFIASAEKALLDFIYLKTRRISWDFLEELRLQNINKVSVKKLLQYAERFNRKDILQAAELIVEYIEKNRKQEKEL